MNIEFNGLLLQLSQVYQNTEWINVFNSSLGHIYKCKDKSNKGHLQCSILKEYQRFGPSIADSM